VADKKLKFWFNISFAYLVIIAIIGVYLRLMFIPDLSWLPNLSLAPKVLFGNDFKFSFLLHSHSHVAMLGWVTTAIFLVIINNYFPDYFGTKNFRYLFILLQVSIIGMLFSFSIQGYKAFSIAFSSLHIFLSYWFIYIFFRISHSQNLPSDYSLKFTKVGLLSLFISSFGPWGLAVFIASGGSQSAPFYSMAIYFFLHFLYNGFFTFTLIGMFLRLLELNNIHFDINFIRKSYILLSVTILPAYLLSLIGYNLNVYLIIVSVVIALVQLFGIKYFFVQFLIVKKTLFPLFPGTGKIFLLIALVSLFMKFLFQFFSVIPGISEFAFKSREIILSYLHLVYIGFITCSLFVYFSLKNVLNLKSLSSLTFLSGFILTELFLIAYAVNSYVGLSDFKFYYIILFIGSFLMLIGLLWMFALNLFKRKIL
jgi:hypothetical protein